VKLLVPSWRDLDSADACLIRLAEFLGGSVEVLPLESTSAFSEAFFEQRVTDKNACLVINSQVLRRSFASESFPPELASYLLSSFPSLLVYNLRPEDFSASTIKAFSGGRLQSVSAVEGQDATYTVAAETSEMAGCFSGLTFRATGPAQDQVFSENAQAGAVRTLIALDNRPLLASIRENGAEVFFLATPSLANLAATWDGKPLIQYFSRLIPVAMVVRHLFGDQCWRPNQSHATLIIDDPLLQTDYGFLNYEDVLRSMDAHNFHTSIAFIPHNFRRNSPGITRMFRKRADRYSICYHGNDHTGAEFAASDTDLLNGMLRVAEARMDAYHKTTGLECDKVMVFPQGNFSSTAMKVLRARNFYAAVNTGAFPRGETAALSLADVLQPAILSYGGFPLFLRKYVRKITSQDIAFDLFFGKPLFVVEHHDIFKDPEALAELVNRVNALVPEIQWSSLRTAIENSWLARRGASGEIDVRVFSKTSRISNSSVALQRYAVEWPERGAADIEKIELDGAICNYVRGDDGGVRFPLTLAPGESRLVSVVHENKFGISDANTRFGWAAKAFMRRRLSEMRDNHLSRNPQILSLAKFLQKRLLSGGAAKHEPAE
jgi:hypothetical protein